MSERLQRSIAIVTIGVDVVLMFLAFALAYVVRYQLQWFRDVDPAYYTTFWPYVPMAALLTGLVLVAFFLEGVYRPRRGATAVDEIYAVISGVATGFVVLVFIVFFWRPLVYSRLIFVYTVALMILLLSLARLVRRGILSYLRQHGAGVDRVLVAGSGELGRRVMRNLLARPDLGYQVVGFVDDDPQKATTDLGRVQALGTTEDVPHLLQEHHVDEVIITLPSSAQPKIMRLVEQCLEAQVRPRLVPDMYQMSLSGVAVEEVAGIPMLSPYETRLSPWATAIKRSVDVLGSAIGLLVLFPLLALIAALIRLDSPGPPIFTQLRVGRGGRVFYVYKFRTMVQGADAIKEHFRHLNEAAGPMFKIRDDPRVTRVGRTLRKTSLDELPQLWNVLKGDMSLVGPRPALPEEVAGYREWHRMRLNAAPGMTGLWQISGRSDLPFDDMVLLDLYYIENWSPLLDLSILVRTVPKILLREGAY
jgi:exopolysaccharide biosynthesis polyprenyl glycosylphosphotransferase